MPNRTAPSISSTTRVARSLRPNRSTPSRALSTKSTTTTSKTPPQPTTYQLPIRSQLHAAAATSQAASNASQFQNTQPLVPPTELQTLNSSQFFAEHTKRPPPTKDIRIPPKTSDLLRLPFHMPNVSQGDILRLNRASILGSRDFTLKAGTRHSESYDQRRTGEPNYLDERLFECRARVMGVESQPMTVKVKKLENNRKARSVKSKHRYTVLRVMEVRVKSLEEVMRADDGVQLVLE
ncbi:Homocitrate dehydratase, mitochondrial [Cyphellophora attinorum]|uniref:Homocitrate dehydratase, mitochondrial n=1 Tax=Cyphellophora attinorum TaxID=1664694 RepID=A0A0N1NX52_9EURO|nr:Homocitrate dehydratase, mitochondrial [Phialophora attinorum]KPI34840.1 Homocitrate dehydratase, mitochondrial [Phialophora attinorum]